jgi:hypothetical protein
VEHVGVDFASPRVDLVGREGGLILFAGLGAVGEVGFVFCGIVCNSL